jgi:hypothetical protein
VLVVGNSVAYRSEVTGKSPIYQSPHCLAQNIMHCLPACVCILLKSSSHFVKTNVASNKCFGLVDVGLWAAEGVQLQPGNRTLRSSAYTPYVGLLCVASV